MHYKKLLIIIALVFTTPLISHQSDKQLSVSDDIDSLLTDLADTCPVKDYDKQPTPQPTTTITEQIKVNARKIGIMLLACAVDAQQWLIKTNAHIRWWLSNT